MKKRKRGEESFNPAVQRPAGHSRTEAQAEEMGWYRWQTDGGHQLDEVVAALQKGVRRGLEAEAMFWALEMADAGFRKYLWKRLMLKATEDIGLGDPQALVLTIAAWQATQESTKSFDPDAGGGMRTEFLGDGILYLCRGPKTRVGDDFAWHIRLQRESGWRIPIPDSALENHTQQGRRLRRGDAFGFAECAKLARTVEIEGNKYEKLGRAQKLAGEQGSPPDVDAHEA